MPVEVRYCNQCGIKIAPREIERGLSVELKGTCYCHKCFGALPEAIQKKIKDRIKKEAKKHPQKQTKPPSSRLQRSSSAIIKIHSARSAKAPKTLYLSRDGELIQPPKKSLPLLWIGLGILGAILFGWFFLRPSPPIKKKPHRSPPPSTPTKDGLSEKKKAWEKKYRLLLAYHKKAPRDWQSFNSRFARLIRQAPNEKSRRRAQKKWIALKKKKPRPIPKPDRHQPRNFRGEFWASRRSPVFHRSSCKWAKKIKVRNLRKYKSRAQALKTGKKPCRTCKP